MSSDTNVALAGARAEVLLRTERLTLYMTALGLNKDAATIGRLIGMSARTVSRAKTGVIGEAFIAATLSAFGQHQDTLARFGLTTQFEDFFEISDAAEAA